jgi:hypothetical protein
MNKENLIKFSTSIKKGFGTIRDASVKGEYMRIYEEEMNGEDLAYALAFLEKNELLDKKNCVNHSPNFYQEMYKKLKDDPGVR